MRSANATETNIELDSMCAMWPRQVRACVLRHAKCARNQAPAFMATRQGGSDHPMSRTLLQHGPLEEGADRPERMSCEFKLSTCRGQCGGGAPINFSNYKMARTVHRSHLDGRGRTRAITHPVHEEISMVGMSAFAPRT